jgi:uncharacterized membrane protein
VAALSYLWITALVILFIDAFPKSRFVRFHCLQAIFFGLAAFVLNVALAVFARLLDPIGSPILIYVTVWGLLRLALFLVWLLALLKAYLGVEYTLPGIGPIARKYSL